MAATGSDDGLRKTVGLAPDLPFEKIPTYPVLHFVARNGKAIAALAAVLALMAGVVAASALGSATAVAIGVLAGGFVGFILLILAELTRALVDIMLPR